MKEICGCGKPVRYIDSKGIESCNKYGRCPTYEELNKSAQRIQRCLTIYQNAINKIDDYFEYSSESKVDQKKVYQIIGNMSDDLKKVDK